MRREATLVTLLACLSVHALHPSEAFADNWNRVIFRDDCDSLDPSVWTINHPGQWWWIQGRTHFPEPTTPPPSPRVEAGACVIEHHLFNPWDGADPNTVFLGGEIRTVREFTPDRAYRFEARVRTDANPNGLVTSFFLFGWDGAKSDEIDFEFVSNKTNDDAGYPSGDPVLTNTWNESFQLPLYAPPLGLVDLSQWNTFRIYWYPGDHRVDWYWVDPLGAEILLRSESNAFFIPDEPMAVYFNFWAPSSNWAEAHDAGLQPVNTPGQNEIHRYAIDYLEVRVSTPPVPSLSQGGRGALAVLIAGIGAACLRRRTTRSRRNLSLDARNLGPCPTESAPWVSSESIRQQDGGKDFAHRA